MSIDLVRATREIARLTAALANAERLAGSLEESLANASGACGRLEAERDALRAELETARQALGDAAREINCSGPVDHRIRVLREEHAATLTARDQERDALAHHVEVLDGILAARDTAGRKLRAALETIRDQAEAVCFDADFKNILGQPLCRQCEDVLPRHSEPNSDCIGWAGNVANAALAAAPEEWK